MLQIKKAKILRKPLAYILILFLVILSIKTTPTFAEDTETSLGFAPDSLHLSLKAGEVYTDEIILWSHDLNAITLYSAITTFKQVEYFPGTAAPLLENKTITYPFSAATWVTETPSEVTLKEGGENTLHVPFEITVPYGTKDGLYRVKIAFTTNSDFNTESDVQTRNNLLIGPSILITVGENLKESLIFQKVTIRNEFTAFYTDKGFYDSLPVKLTANLYNDGETYVIPVGDIIIYNWLNQEIDRIKFNKETLSLINDEIGSFDTLWAAETQLLDLLIDDKIAFGKMHAKLIFTYSTTDPAFSALSAETSFWIIPWKILLAIILSVVTFITLKIRKLLQKIQENKDK